MKFHSGNGHDFSHLISMSSVTVIMERHDIQQVNMYLIPNYVFDHHNNCYKLKKILPLGMFFPIDFGFIESTHAGDGDPADEIVITE
jgi:inorganic pyrophosphatase